MALATPLTLEKKLAFTAPHRPAALASKGLGAASLLMVACDTLKLRATSACASPLQSR